MDHLSLESSLLLQGGEPYYGRGWSSTHHHPGSSTSGAVADDSGIGYYGWFSTDDGRHLGGTGYITGDIVDRSYLNTMGGNGGGSGTINAMTTSQLHNPKTARTRMPTPLDPLLKHLKREYAASAGPQDVLASVISNRELEFLLNTATTNVNVNPNANTHAVAAVSVGKEAASSSGMTTGGAVSSMTPVTGKNAMTSGEKHAPTEWQGWSHGNYLPSDPSDDNAIRSWEDDAARASTPLASGGRAATRGPRLDDSFSSVANTTGTSSSNNNSYPDRRSSLNSDVQSSIHSTENSTTLDLPSVRGQHHHRQDEFQLRKKRRLPPFCYAPSSHVDNLLQATPHLRHLSAASTDMSGIGTGESKNFFAQLLSFTSRGGQSSNGSSVTVANVGLESSSLASATLASGSVDYSTSILRQRANHAASLELASFLRVLSNEMPHDKFVAVESEVYSKIFSLVHSKAARGDERLAGVAALDALISVPSSDEEKKAIRFGNNLSHGLKAPYADFEFLHAIAKALGKMSLRSANVDRVEFEIVRCLEWLRTDRSDRKLAAVLVLRELARCAPTAFYSKTHNVNVQHHAATAAGSSGGGGGLAAMAGLGGTNEFLDNILPCLRDPQPIVRVCAADALAECLKILMERQRGSMTAPLCTLYANMMEGLEYHGSVDGQGAGSAVDDKNNAPSSNRDSSTVAVTEATNVHGSLLTASEMIEHSKSFILPRFDELTKAILKFTTHPMALVRLEVIRLIPKLATRCPGIYRRRYLDQSLTFLIESASSAPPPKSRVDVRPTAFSAIGQLASAMRDEEAGGGDIMGPTVRIMKVNPSFIDEKKTDEIDHYFVELDEISDFNKRINTIFGLISENLQSSNTSALRLDVLGCFANMVEALGHHAAPYVPDLTEDMFKSGLSVPLIQCLHSIAASVPSEQLTIERRLFEEISFCLAGTKAVDLTCDLFSLRRNTTPKTDLQKATSDSRQMEKATVSNLSLSSMNPNMRPKTILSAEPDTQHIPILNVVSPKSSDVLINMSQKPEIVDKLVLSLLTLRTIGESYMRANGPNNGNLLLPFLRNVICMYLEHPSSDVRREATITCCLLLLPFNDGLKRGQNFNMLLDFNLGHVSTSLMEEVLQKLLRLAVSDLSPVVRLCVIRGLDSRYDPYLCQLNLLPPLFLVLEDEALAVRACVLQLLGRLSRLNPAPILPSLRRVLMDLIIELRCGGDNDGSREAATRLIIVFLRVEALQRLVRPFISSIIDALPLANVAPRLMSASLEALGELANVAHSSLNPWLRQLVPHILENIQDQNSSKQRVSLSTLGKIAFGTGYVVSPYLDYPQLLHQAAEILPTTKRAPWELRREVFRTFGILGALDPDRLGSSTYKTRKGGGVGGGYFVEMEDEDNISDSRRHSALVPTTGSIKRGTDLSLHHSTSLSPAQFSGGRSLSSGHAGIYSTDSQHRAATGENLDEVLHRKMYKDSDNDEPAHLYMYEQYAMTAQPLSQLPPARRLSPSDDDFYPTVTVQALMRILKDSSLSNLHGMVMKAVMFIFNALGIRSVPFLKRIVPHILATVKNCGQSGLREALLQQVASLSSIVHENLRPYLPAIFDVVEEFWFSRHLSALCSLVERVAAAVPDDFRKYVPLLVRQILASVEGVNVSEWSSSNDASSEIERLELILKHVQGIKHVLGEYIHLIIPALVQLTESLIAPGADGVRISPKSGSGICHVAVETVETVTILLQTIELNSNPLDNNIKSNSALPARVVQPFLRMLGGEVKPNKPVGTAIIQCLCVCIRQLGSGRWLSFYDSTARETINMWQTKVGFENVATRAEEDYRVTENRLRSFSRPIDIYTDAVAEITNIGNRFGSEEDGSRSESSFARSGPSEVSLARMGSDITKLIRNPPSIQPILHQPTTAHRINFANLQRAWDVSQRSTREDWDEWMRRFSVQLLREAPSPALRACAELAQAYQPLARELFSAAFVCCWSELNDQYRSSLVYALETVFSADASLEILQLLLNLAEFMEHDVDCDGVDVGLPIDISILAELALKCRAYAKALHYKEREYIMGRGGTCVEQLIDINKKLDLPEAALGVLKLAKIEIERRGVRSFVSSDRNGEKHQDKGLAYSVIKSYSDAAAGDYGSWAGDVMYESWLAKLGSWAEAVAMYEQKLRENPDDVNSILGCMKCYDARGEWQKALDLAGRSWGALLGNDSVEANSYPGAAHRTKRRSSSHHHKRALKFCAQAAWRLGKWDELETFSSHLVHGSYGTSHTHSSDTTSMSLERSRLIEIPKLDFDAAFYRSVLLIHRAEWGLAANSIDAARKAMDSRFTALLAESYKRAYPSMVAAQTLTELEEVINYRQFEIRTMEGLAHLHSANRPDEKQARQHLLDVWRRRLDGCRVDAEVHSSILAVRSLVLGPTDEVDATITLAALSRQAEAYQLAERTLLDPLSRMGCSLNSPIFGFNMPPNLKLDVAITSRGVLENIINGTTSIRMPYGSHHEQYSRELVKIAGSEDRLFIQHKLYFAYIKHLWATDRRNEALERLGYLCRLVDLTTHYSQQKPEHDALRMSCWLRYGDWKVAGNPPGTILNEGLAVDVLISYKRAADVVSSSYRAWHSWALINFRLAEQIHAADKDLSESKQVKPVSMLQSHVIAAVKGFVKAISVGTKRWSASVQQDMLNLLSCLFKYGDLPDVARTINEGLVSIKIESWLGVLPQLLARIHMKSPSVRSVLHPLLVRLGAKHPQALMYPLSVLIKSPVVDRKLAAESLMNSLKAHSNALVEEALMVSSELIRVAILWLELWHEGLEDASRLYYGEGNVSGMLDVLNPLHSLLEKGPQTRREQDFHKSFGRDLTEAHHHVKEYVRLILSSGQSIPTQGGFMPDPNQAGRTSPANAEAEAALNQAWDLYYQVFRRINKQLPGMTTLELNHCSPALHNARNLELGVPGSYRVDGSYVKIQRFITNVQVITTKQRPRKIIIRGNDGKDYVCLLKGHEDLRQDERVMQLFGLVNALLARDRRTNKHDLNIQRYSITPLSHNCGVVGWVPHCDTLHCLIRDYRESMKIPLNMENREMMNLTPNYDSLPTMQKVEVFTEALERTAGKGNDLYEVLWVKSTNSEEWLERRTNFTRSLAVMSMVGYILGLGDRHPSNLMMDQISGRILHIDFGDCFEVAMHREKFPEKVPFRLTRMLTRAMEVSGIEGSYRSTCERTMSVLRDNKDSLVAMLEAFVYDPLISWRLLDQSGDEEEEEDEEDEEPSSQRDSHSTRILPVSATASHTIIPEPIHEGQDEDGDEDEDDKNDEASDSDGSGSETDNTPALKTIPADVVKPHTYTTSQAKSLQMYSEMKALAANLSTSSRIASITGGTIDAAIEHGSTARSRIDKSVRQRELMSFLDGDEGAANEEALNERALKVIRRVQDKLTGTDFHGAEEVVREPLDVQDQVQRLIVQATSSENLCQLFIGWCAFW